MRPHQCEWQASRVRQHPSGDDVGKWIVCVVVTGSLRGLRRARGVGIQVVRTTIRLNIFCIRLDSVDRRFGVVAFWCGHR